VGETMPALRRHSGWAAAAGAAFATLGAAAGVVFCDRILVRLDAAITEQEILQAELEAAHRTTMEFRSLAYHDDKARLGRLPTGACIDAVQERVAATPQVR
jgi:hypothetical protein